MTKICNRCGCGANDFEVVCSKCAGTVFGKAAVPQTKVTVKEKPAEHTAVKSEEPVAEAAKEKPVRKRR